MARYSGSPVWWRRGDALLCGHSPKRRFHASARGVSHFWVAHGHETPDWDSALASRSGDSSRRWPGAEKFAFRCNYRHERRKGDVKYVWEVNRLQFLPVAALAGRDDLVVEGLRSWMKMNPPFRGINWTSGIEAATRVISLLATYGFLGIAAQRELDRDIRSFTGRASFLDQAVPVALFSSANNHRVAELSVCAIRGVQLCTCA